jgi:hypothetical protein
MNTPTYNVVPPCLVLPAIGLRGERCNAIGDIIVHGVVPHTRLRLQSANPMNRVVHSGERVLVAAARQWRGKI